MERARIHSLGLQWDHKRDWDKRGWQGMAWRGAARRGTKFTLGKMPHKYRVKVPAGAFCSSKRAKLRKQQRAFADRSRSFLYPVANALRQEIIELRKTEEQEAARFELLAAPLAAPPPPFP